MKHAKRVVHNSLFLYLKVVVSLLFALISTRLILKALGTEDYGLFNLIGGIILLFSFLNGAMTVTTQRYLSYFAGKDHLDKTKEVFKTSITLHLLIGLLIVITLEIIGGFLFDHVLNIPESKLGQAQILYQFMIISTFFTISAVPFDAAINANEDLFFDSVMGMIEAGLKLLIAVFVFYYKSEKLILFGILMTVLVIVIRIVKIIWCTTHYKECQVKNDYSIRSSLFREMGLFSIWNLFGALCYVANSQGIAVILNLFFGVTINSTYAIASQVNSQMMGFSSMLVKAFNPQIVKSEGAGDRNRMLKLATQSSKFSVFLLLILVIPLLTELPFLLKIWLGTVPKFTIEFTAIILIISLVSQMSAGLKISIQATGDIKLYQFVVGSTILLNLPVAYLLMSFDYKPYFVVYSVLVIETLSLVIRIAIVKKKTGLPVKMFTYEVILKSILIFLISSAIALITQLLFVESFLRLCVVTIFSSTSSSLLIWFFGFTTDERKLLKGILLSFTKK